MSYEFHVLHKTLPKLNSLHMSNNEHIQKVGKATFQLLGTPFSFPDIEPAPSQPKPINFSKGKFRDFNETRLYLLKLCVSNLADLAYQYIVPSKYRLSNILQQSSTDFSLIYRWFRLQLLQSKKHLLTSEEILNKISSPINVINSF